MNQIILTIKDSQGHELNLGDTVRVFCTHVSNSAYYTTLDIVSDRLFPHDFFAYSSITKVESIPDHAKPMTDYKDDYPDVYTISEQNDGERDFNSILDIVKLSGGRAYSISRGES